MKHPKVFRGLECTPNTSLALRSSRLIHDIGFRGLSRGLESCSSILLTWFLNTSAVGYRESALKAKSGIFMISVTGQRAAWCKGR